MSPNVHGVVPETNTLQKQRQPIYRELNGPSHLFFPGQNVIEIAAPTHLPCAQQPIPSLLSRSKRY